MNYKRVQIGEITTLRQGFAINKNTKHHMSDEPTSLHLLRIGDMKDGTFSIFVKDTIPQHFIATNEDIIYTRTGQVGLVFRNQNGVVHNNCFTVSPLDDNELSRDFLYYVLQTKEFYDEANSKASGAAQPDLAHGSFKSIEIPLPPLETQRRIASILSAYDDLIDNNQKQIKLLEEAAQRLYKEWFVDLHFPGYENVKVVDGVPEGWSESIIGDIVCYHDKKRKPLSAMQRSIFQGEYRYFGAAGILDHVKEYLFDGTYLLFGEDGTVITPDGYPVLQYVSGKFWVNNHAHVLTGKEPISTEFLYMMFKKMGISDVVTGVAQPKISQARLSNKKVIIPTDSLIIKYHNAVKPIFDMILNIENQIQYATEARDRLLPKLMSGELEV